MVTGAYVRSHIVELEPKLEGPAANQIAQPEAPETVRIVAFDSRVVSGGMASITRKFKDYKSFSSLPKSLIDECLKRPLPLPEGLSGMQNSLFQI